MSPAKSGMDVLGRTAILRGFSPFNFKYAPSGMGRSLRRLAKTQFAAEFVAHSENGAKVASKIENVCGFFKIQPSISAWLEAPKKSMNKIASDAFKPKVSIWFSEYVFTSKKLLKNIGKDGQISSGRNIVFMPDFFRKGNAARSALRPEAYSSALFIKSKKVSPPPSPFSEGSSK